MARFTVNRRWTFILALCVFFVASSFAHRSAEAGFGHTEIAPTTPPPDGVGDPDVPIGPSKGSNVGYRDRGKAQIETRTAGDGRFSRSVAVWRLRVVLQGLKGFYLRF